MSKSSSKCSIWVRNLPLDRYRLPSDGRKWKQAARSRSALLLRLSSYANGDGTFIGETGINYSPSFETLEKHIARPSFYRVTDALRALGLLSWTRERHYERRVYTIHLSETGITFDSEQVSHSKITGTTFDRNSQEQVPHSEKQVPHSQEQVPHSQITGSTMGNYPSLPSLPSEEPSREREPSASQKQNSKPSLSLASPAAGSKPAQKDRGQEKPKAKTCRWNVDAIMTAAKLRTKKNIEFSAKSESVLLGALAKIPDITDGEIYAAIQRNIDGLTDAPSEAMFGARFAGNLVSNIQAARARDRKAAADRERATAYTKFQQERDVWLAAFAKMKDDETVDAARWFEANETPYYRYSTDDCENNYCDRMFMEWETARWKKAWAAVENDLSVDLDDWMKHHEVSSLNWEFGDAAGVLWLAARAKRGYPEIVEASANASLPPDKSACEAQS